MTHEQNDPSARPAIQGKCDALANCDVVFLGYPIWWGMAPKVIYTFLENHDLTDKTVIPFCTSHSSGIGSSDTDLHRLATGSEWKQALELILSQNIIKLQTTDNQVQITI